MKKMRLIMAGTLCLFMSAAFAQESSDLDTIKNPVQQGDPTVRQSPEQIQENTLRDMVEISESEIPSTMQNALKGKDYQGESKTFYKSKDGESYAVEIKDGNITQTYRFNKQGKAFNDRNP